VVHDSTLASVPTTGSQQVGQSMMSRVWKSIWLWELVLNSGLGGDLLVVEEEGAS